MHAKSRARQKNITFSIKFQDLLAMWSYQEGRCNLSGRSMTIVKGSPELVSIDRIDSSVGYERDNIQLLCSAVNLAKNVLNEEYFIDICKDIARRNNK